MAPGTAQVVPEGGPLPSPIPTDFAWAIIPHQPEPSPTAAELVQAGMALQAPGGPAKSKNPGRAEIGRETTEILLEGAHQHAAA